MKTLTNYYLLLLWIVFSSASADSNKRIALSFDDAPRGTGPMFSGEQRSQALLDSLKDASTGPVVFFVTTKNLGVDNNIRRIEKYAQAGHLIANHSHHHPWLHQVDAKTYIEGIDTAESLLTDLENRRPWFRFPYLDEGRTVEKRNEVRKALKKRGLQNGYVTVDNYDWYLEQKWLEAIKDDKIVDRNALRLLYVDLLVGAVNYYDKLAKDTLKRSPAHVLLLHENDLAALFIDDLVRALRKQGWNIISPDEAYDDPIAASQPKTLMANQGLIAALAIENGMKPSLLSHTAIEERQIDQMLTNRLVFRTKQIPQLRNPH